MENFLSNENLCILSVSLNETKSSLDFRNEIPNDDQNRLLFFKHNIHGGLEDETRNTTENLGFISLNGGIVQSIYETIASTSMLNVLTVSSTLQI